MATATDAPALTVSEDAPYLISGDVFTRMVEDGLFPPESRVYLWGGRLYEEMAKTRSHAAVQSAIVGALSRRLPPGLFLGAENPVRLDPTHLPLPDLVVARGNPLDYFDTRYPGPDDVVLVVEVAVTSRKADLGPRLVRHARAIPSAVPLVADVSRRQTLVHTKPAAGGYAEVTTVGPGQSPRLHLDGAELEPIPYEEVMR